MSLEKGRLKSKNVQKLKVNFNLTSELILFTYDKKQEILNEQKTSVKKKKTNTWIFLLVNVVIVAAIFIYQFCFGETKPLSELFAERPFYRFFFISLGAVAVFYIAMGIGYAILTKVTTRKFNFFLGLEFAVVGKYWDSITPFSSGGQFAQVAHGRKRGIPGDKSTSIVVGKYMIGMVAYVLFGLVALFIPIETFTTGIIIKVLAGVGVGINLLLTLFVWIVSINRKLCVVIVVGGIKLLHKMKIIKNYNYALYKSMRFIRQYQKAFKFLISKPWVLIAELFIAFVELLANSLIPFLIYLAFNPTGGVSVISIIAMSFLCFFATSFIPIPGGSGVAEISFAALFSKLFADGTTFWALLIWRIFTYYILIIVGFVYTVIESLVSKRKKKFSQKI